MHQVVEHVSNAQKHPTSSYFFYDCVVVRSPRPGPEEPACTYMFRVYILLYSLYTLRTCTFRFTSIPLYDPLTTGHPQVVKKPEINPLLGKCVRKHFVTPKKYKNCSFYNNTLLQIRICKIVYIYLAEPPTVILVLFCCDSSVVVS